jgi:hypothetical protein
MTEPIILACARLEGDLLFPDNKTGSCDVCGVVVQFRPHAPEPRVLRCMDCTFELFEPGDTLSTNQRMIDDFKTYLRKQMQ